MVVSNDTLKYTEIVGLKDKFIKRLGDSHDRSLRGKKEKW